jgi:hypothetical protein
MKLGLSSGRAQSDVPGEQDRPLATFKMPLWIARQGRSWSYIMTERRQNHIWIASSFSENQLLTNQTIALLALFFTCSPRDDTPEQAPLINDRKLDFKP